MSNQCQVVTESQDKIQEELQKPLRVSDRLTKDMTREELMESQVRDSSLNKYFREAEC